MVLVLMMGLVSSVSFILPSMMQPLSLGISIMILSMFSCLLIGLELSSWYGYIVFLIYVGGLLVMFSYVAALMPNNFFGGGENVVLFFVSLLVYSIMSSEFWFFNSSKMICYLNKFFMSSEGMSGILLCSDKNYIILIFLGVILFLALVAVVKICFIQEAPLRPFKYA